MSHVSVLAIVALAAGLRFYGLRFGLPHPFARPDENTIVWIALAVLDGDPNPHFFRYPTLFIYVTAATHWVVFLAQRLAGRSGDLGSFIAQVTVDPSTVYMVPRVLAASAGTLTVAALYGAARELYSRRAATLAALFLAVAFLHVRDSHFGVTDVPATLLAVCAFWAAVGCFRRGPTMRGVAVAGALCGLAASTKYNMALTLMPLLVAILSHAGGPRNGISSAWRYLAVAAFCAAGGFLLGTPYALLDSEKFLADFNAERLHFLGGGGRWIDRGWVHHLTFNLRYGLGLPLLSAAMAGAAWLCAKRSWRSALLLSFPCAYYAVMGTGFTVFARYMVPIVPFACLGAAILVDRIGARVGGGGRSPGMVAGLVSVLAVLLALPGAAQDLAFDRLVSQPDTRILAARWVEQTYPSGITMYQTGAVFGHMVPRPASRCAQFTFDEPRARFVRDGEATTTLPELIAVLESPLAQFSKVPPSLRSILSRHYAPRVSFEATRSAGARPPVYDQQDAFFVPFDRPGEATRPGPDVTLYERVAPGGPRADTRRLRPP